MNFLRKLMYGRYGSDQLNLFLLIACLICWLLCRFIRHPSLFRSSLWLGMCSSSTPSTAPSLGTTTADGQKTTDFYPSQTPSPETSGA